jgi:hypothetical protein
MADGVEQDETGAASKQKGKRTGSIHIEFARARVSIEGTADAATLCAVLECLAG